MRVIIALILLLIAAPRARAETPLATTEVRPEIAQAAVEAKAPKQPVLVLSQVKLPEYGAAATSVAAPQEMPQRGSFWWLVGVIVVAGVIVALLLD